MQQKLINRVVLPRLYLMAMLAWVSVIAGVFPSSSLAQQADPAQLQQALNKAQALLRQLAQQKGALQAEKAEMQAALAASERKLKKEQNANAALASIACK